ncbi:MAG: nicotinate-nucleotide--dimethylbenzimidazole phosphoribosyltransferase [Mesorhizobium sp.]|nr:nicotinate-nucleotide--dimethylbenzimidazole phosphoribosyltransferase [Mesorhizobium sp.]
MNMVTGLPLDDVRSLLKRLPGADAAAAGSARQKAGALATSGFDIARAGRLGEWVSAWSGRFPPRPTRTVVAIFIGTHGVAGQGISARSPGFEQRFVEHAAAGGAPVSQICGTHDFGLKIFDLALDLPVADITAEPALDERGCAATIAFGMEAVAGGADLMCLGGLGEGGEVAAAAVLSTLVGGTPAEWLEEADAQLKDRRSAAAEKALAVHGTALRDPLEALRRLGGREMAAIAGAILAARTEKVPVVLDGMAALSAAVILHAVSPGSVDHCLLADARGAVQAKIAAHLGIDRVLDLGLGSGDGTAGAMAAGSIRDACLLLDQTVPLPGA